MYKRYYQVNPNSDLFKRTIEYRKFLDELCVLLNEFAKTHGIESGYFIPSVEFLEFQPTENDYMKFGNEFVQSKYGRFKKTSKTSKEWVAFCKEKGLEQKHEPSLRNYIDYTFSFGSYVFKVNENTVFAVAKSHNDFSIKEDHEDILTEIKPSKFFEVLEENGFDTNDTEF